MKITPPPRKRSAKKRLKLEHDPVAKEKKEAIDADFSPLPGIGSSQSASIVQMQDFLLNTFQVRNTRQNHKILEEYKYLIYWMIYFN